MVMTSIHTPSLLHSVLRAFLAPKLSKYIEG
jgi:hypothetical protein